MKYAIELGLKMLNTPYKWGGNSALDGGLDCSGFVCELLRTEGLIGPEDHSAQNLYDMFIDKFTYKDNSPEAGDLVFFGKSTKEISHIGFMLNHLQMLEAGGGNSTTNTLSMAAAMKAMIRIRPFDRRKDVVGFVRPGWQISD
jgi:cell wall-associated NlpC family hydrolase